MARDTVTYDAAAMVYVTVDVEAEDAGAAEATPLPEDISAAVDKVSIALPDGDAAHKVQGVELRRNLGDPGLRRRATRRHPHRRRLCSGGARDQPVPARSHPGAGRGRLYSLREISRLRLGQGRTAVGEDEG